MVYNSTDSVFVHRAPISASVRYIILPNNHTEKSVLTVDNFYFLQKDTIDLTHYAHIQSFNDLNITAGSVIITLTPYQTIRLLNLSPKDMTARSFLFASLDSARLSNDSSTTTIVAAVITGAVLLCFIASCFMNNPENQTKMDEENNAKIANQFIAKETKTVAQLSKHHSLMLSYQYRTDQDELDLKAEIEQELLESNQLMQSMTQKHAYLKQQLWTDIERNNNALGLETYDILSSSSDSFISHSSQESDNSTHYQAVGTVYSVHREDKDTYGGSEDDGDW